MKPETAPWVEIAEQDVRSAQSLLRDELWANGAYFCQQSVEKLLKGAVVERHDFEPPRTHDLVELADLAVLELTDEQRLFLTRLTDHAVATRYPGGEYEEEEVRQLFEETKEFYAWLRAKLT